MSSPASIEHGMQLLTTYKRARDFYLVQQFGEAFDEISSLLNDNNVFVADLDNGPGSARTQAPVFHANMGLKVKIWSLYLTLLNTLRDVGGQKASAYVGAQRWQRLSESLHNGSIWQHVVDVGFAGDEQVMDIDIVIALVTLCLADSNSSQVVQERIEAVLASEHPNASADLLAKYNRLIDLFVLHVLPTNDQWEYARAFVENSEHLDLDSKAKYQEALDLLYHSAQRMGEERCNASLSSTDTLRNHVPTTSTPVRGISVLKGAPQTPCRSPGVSQYLLRKHSPNTMPNSANGQEQVNCPTARVLEKEPSGHKMGKPDVNPSVPVAHVVQRSQWSQRSKAQKRNGPQPFMVLKTIIMNGTQLLKKNPQIALRIVLFCLFIHGLFSNRRAQLLIEKWGCKAKQTALMGMKISYV